MELEVNQFEHLEDFKEGVVLLVDKPLEWTSFDVVNKVRGILRRKLKVKKIKVGHAGTLDPLATGLLVICTGKMTKQIQYIMDGEKGYTGTILFGGTTPSFDLETEVDQTYPTDHLTAELLKEKAQAFEPGYMQTAPVFSAKKVDGKAAYLSARKGKEVKIEPRYVMIHQFKLTSLALPEVEFDVECGKGTYIRSLAHDLGKQVDSGAHLTSLRRYRSGEFHVKDAFTIESLMERIEGLQYRESAP